MKATVARPNHELATYIVLTSLFLVLQLAGLARGLDSNGLVSHFSSQSLTYEFSFSQLRHLGPEITLVWLLGVAVFILLFHRYPKPFRVIVQVADRLLANPWVAIVVSLACARVFYALSNEFINPDGRLFQAAFSSASGRPDSVLTHDEIWEFFLHWKLWYWGSQHLGWTAAETYHIASSLAGAGFIFVLIALSHLLVPAHPTALFLAVTSAGFMQLFFGDVENYTLTALLILCYLFTAILHIKGRVSLVVPSAILAVAVTFHLLAATLLPSLIYLAFRSVSNFGRRSIYAPLAAFLAITLATLVGFHYGGLPISNLFFHTHAFGHGGAILANFAFPSLSPYLQHANLLLLLSPSVIILLPLVVFRRFPSHPTNILLVIAAASLVAFQLTWRSGIGVYNDWNLYAASAIPISVLMWANFLTNVRMRWRAEVFVALVALTGMQSLIWIVWNHYYPYGY